ncbi:transglutaminaseTgpA domain-containing protein [Paenibacillus sp. FA6]|uniref:transglutaminase family protein n=1 Tax=Paenibacillus sp. FA6 TaxID=3413029 RepID=UPI003F6608A8
MMVPIQNTDSVMYNPMVVTSHRTNSSFQKSRKGDTLLYRMLLTIPLMGLLTEWLYPLQSIYDGSLSVSLINVLYGLTALLLLVGMFRWKHRISIPLYIILTIGSWVFLFEQDRGLESFLSYGAIAQQDIMTVIQEWTLSTVSAETRTLILIIGWGLLVSTVQSLVLDRSSIGLFAMATVIYLLCLEAVLGLDVYADIIRSAFLLMVLVGGLSLSRHREQSSHSYALRNRRYVGWFVSVCMVTIVAVGIAWLGGRVITVEPAQTKVVQSGVTTLEEWLGMKMNQTSSKSAVTGYGAGEGDMGIPLKPSNEIVFTAESPIPSYWRGESFGYYDGRRWAEPQVYFHAIDMKAQLRKSISSKEEKTESIVQTIRFNPSMTDEFPLFSGGDVDRILNITTMNGERPVYLLHDDMSGTIKYPAASGSSPVTSYQVEVTPSVINANSLRESTGSDPDSVSQRYLQLPEQLPLRIKELGEEITSNTINRYDTALAVESFLQNNYKYSLDTNVPPANEDFVDHFLFQTKMGYCNHFSTSMVILLRSQGIPSRLVKGYAPGTLKSGSQSTYVVRSLNAHSWVEVYFPQMGWIPFDPTPGFSIQEGNSELPIVANHDTEGDGIRESVGDFYTNTVQFLGKTLRKAGMIISESGYRVLGLIFVTILMIACVRSVWRSRRNLFLWRLRFITRSTFPQKEQLLKAAWVVWAEVGRRFGPIPMGTTTREYIHSLKDENLQEELLQFVEQWEVIAYDETFLNRAHSITFLQRCSQLAQSLYN